MVSELHPVEIVQQDGGAQIALTLALQQTSLSAMEKEHAAVDSLEVEIVPVKADGLVMHVNTMRTHAVITELRPIQAYAIVHHYIPEIGRAVQQECRDRSRMPSSA
eukprot:TRINITY_DN5396_c0_g1_i6.p2 TRINITY_DN5396_c0_g1~~TRINITY_DN5396_c0_g1_i6.p2  ORF type:complete len:106 (-),score=10.60 TRINITY_DN5396_c0_g1_i6:10-327(-)